MTTAISRPIAVAVPDPDGPGWRLHSACRNVDPELFWPVGNTAAAIAQAKEAKAVCRGCTVRVQCLRWALDSGEDTGVAGGMSARERRALHHRPAKWSDRDAKMDVLLRYGRAELEALAAEGHSPSVIASRLGATTQVVTFALEDLAAQNASAGKGCAA